MLSEKTLNAIRIIKYLNSVKEDVYPDNLVKTLSMDETTIGTLLEKLLSGGIIEAGNASGCYVLHKPVNEISLMDVMTVIGEELEILNSDGNGRDSYLRLGDSYTQVASSLLAVDYIVRKALKNITLKDM
ncbi:MAG: Rrf2 family transcriptional regulator [Bacteroidales bacterium]|nr:Rrf2 family transcriptional regulator [Bacteroidales bacterium]